MSDDRDTLGVPEILTRYGLKDPRAARRIIDQAGGFIIAGKAVVRRADLLAHEDALKAARRPHTQPERRPRTTSPSRRPKPTTEPHGPGWWRQP